MKIYVGHSKDFDYKNELYKPIRQLEKEINCQFFLPHEDNDINSNSRDFYKQFDLIIAEVSYPSTGLGIELGWAFDDNVAIYCVCKNDKNYSHSLESVTSNFYKYNSTEELIEIIKQIIK